MQKNKLKIGNILLASVMVLLIVSLSYAQDLVLDFEDGDLDDWEVIDEVPANLGDVGPSSWQIKSGAIDGNVLYQGSNIWGSAQDTCLMGTFIIYKAEQFTDFILDVDVFAQDNDGMGIVWAYEAIDKHYRAIMINDGWPAGSVDGVDGPFLKMSKRVDNDEPWYEMLDVVKGNYAPYPESTLLHWTLEVSEGSFTFTREDGLSIEAEDDEYKTGYIGIQLYAQQVEFDNITIVNTYPVDPAGKAATTWASIKR